MTTFTLDQIAQALTDEQLRKAIAATQKDLNEDDVSEWAVAQLRQSLLDALRAVEPETTGATSSAPPSRRNGFSEAHCYSSDGVSLIWICYHCCRQEHEGHDADCPNRSDVPAPGPETPAAPAPQAQERARKESE